MVMQDESRAQKLQIYMKHPLYLLEEDNIRFSSKLLSSCMPISIGENGDLHSTGMHSGNYNSESIPRAELVIRKTEN